MWFFGCSTVYMASIYTPDHFRFHVNLQQRSQTALPSLIHQVTTTQLPTCHRTNKFTAAFQAVIDAYGTATYMEVNPGRIVMFNEEHLVWYKFCWCWFLPTGRGGENVWSTHTSKMTSSYGNDLGYHWRGYLTVYFILVKSSWFTWGSRDQQC